MNDKSSNRRYRLLKDLPHVTQGVEIDKYNSKLYKGKSNSGRHIFIEAEVVESCPDWFEEIVEPERIKVTELYYEHQTAHGREYVFATNSMIPEDKFPSIKIAIENILNSEYPYCQKCFERGVEDAKKEFHPKTYTASQLEEAERNGFKAARKTKSLMDLWQTPLHPTFEDYKSHLINKTNP